MIKVGSERYRKFVEEHFTTCECGYNNKKDRLEIYGTCLRCGKILNQKAYLRYKIKMEQYKMARQRSIEN